MVVYSIAIAIEDLSGVQSDFGAEIAIGEKFRGTPR